MDLATPFTPLSALAGGALIGLSAVILMAANGRIAGISNIAGGLIGPGGGDRGWRIAFLLGLAAAPVLYVAFAGPVEAVVSAPLPVLIVAGLLVGIGTQLGSGCTSGHGVCGMSRLSPRGIAATLTFMGTAAATVFVVRHVLGGA